MNENDNIFWDDLDDDLDLFDMVADIDFMAHIQTIEQEVHVHASHSQLHHPRAATVYCEPFFLVQIQRNVLLKTFIEHSSVSWSINVYWILKRYYCFVYF